jgi:predicted nucleic acid-binding protein
MHAWSQSQVGMTVVDSSAAVALVTDRRGPGEWVAATIAGCRLAAPRLMPFEAGNALRRAELGGDLDQAAAALGHELLLALRVDLWAHSQVAERAWGLRGTFTYYDACYVALAEKLNAPLLTLDRRLARAPGPKCAFLTPPEG